jgi:hypothetical protein
LGLQLKQAEEQSALQAQLIASTPEQQLAVSIAAANDLRAQIVRLEAAKSNLALVVTTQQENACELQKELNDLRGEQARSVNVFRKYSSDMQGKIDQLEKEKNDLVQNTNQMSNKIKMLEASSQTANDQDAEHSSGAAESDHAMQAEIVRLQTQAESHREHIKQLNGALSRVPERMKQIEADVAVHPEPRRLPEPNAAVSDLAIDFAPEKKALEAKLDAAKAQTDAAQKSADFYKGVGLGTTALVAGAGVVAAVYAKQAVPRLAKAIKQNRLINVVAQHQGDGQELVRTVVTTFCDTPDKSNLGALKKLSKNIDSSIALVEEYLSWKSDSKAIEFSQAEDVLVRLFVVRVAVQELIQQDEQAAVSSAAVA